jgi:hypothetical protein
VLDFYDWLHGLFELSSGTGWCDTVSALPVFAEAWKAFKRCPPQF